MAETTVLPKPASKGSGEERGRLRDSFIGRGGQLCLWPEPARVLVREAWKGDGEKGAREKPARWDDSREGGQLPLWPELAIARSGQKEALEGGDAPGFRVRLLEEKLLAHGNADALLLSIRDMGLSFFEKCDLLARGVVEEFGFERCVLRLKGAKGEMMNVAGFDAYEGVVLRAAGGKTARSFALRAYGESVGELIVENHAGGWEMSECAVEVLAKIANDFARTAKHSRTREEHRVFLSLSEVLNPELPAKRQLEKAAEAIGEVFKPYAAVGLFLVNEELTALEGKVVMGGERFAAFRVPKDSDRYMLWNVFEGGGRFIGRIDECTPLLKQHWQGVPFVAAFQIKNGSVPGVIAIGAESREQLDRNADVLGHAVHYLGIAIENIQLRMRLEETVAKQKETTEFLQSLLEEVAEANRRNKEIEHIALKGSDEAETLRKMLELFVVDKRISGVLLCERLGGGGIKGMITINAKGEITDIGKRFMRNIDDPANLVPFFFRKIEAGEAELTLSEGGFTSMLRFENGRHRRIGAPVPLRKEGLLEAGFGEDAIETVVCLPVRVADEARYAVVVVSSRKIDWEEQGRMLRGLQQQAAEAGASVERVRLRRESEELASRDRLTGLYNSAYLMERLAETIEAAPRMKKKPALMNVDIDFFGAVTNVFGQEVGDEFLRQFADALRQECRSMDMVARDGGEEFSIIAAPPEAEGTGAREGAQGFAERLRETMAEHEFEVPVLFEEDLKKFREIERTWNELASMEPDRLAKLKCGDKGQIWYMKNALLAGHRFWIEEGEEGARLKFTKSVSIGWKVWDNEDDPKQWRNRAVAARMFAKVRRNCCTPWVEAMGAGGEESAQEPR